VHVEVCCHLARKALLKVAPLGAGIGAAREKELGAQEEAPAGRIG
jgi:hypothetical protein